MCRRLGAMRRSPGVGCVSFQTDATKMGRQLLCRCIYFAPCDSSLMRMFRNATLHPLP